MSTPQYPDPGSSAGQPASPDQGRYGDTAHDADAAERRGRRLVSGIIGFLATPAAFAMMMYGARALTTRPPRGNAAGEPLDLLLVAVGTLLLLGVATMGTISRVGPVLGGMFWGVLPGVLMMFVPAAHFGMYHFSYGLLGKDVELAAHMWTWMGATVAAGVLLAGLGMTGHLIRRRSARRSAQPSPRA